MAGIEVAPGRDRHVLRAGAAAGNALIDARPARKVYHIVVEGEGAAFVNALEHQGSKLFILLEHHLEVAAGQRGGVVRRTDNRLHTQLCEAEVKHLLYIAQKIGICVGEGAAHVVAFAAARIYKLLELRHNALPAPAAGVVNAEAVMHFLAPVETENDVVHLAVCKVDHVVVDEHSVRREREAEILPVLFLYASCVCDKLLDDFKVHQRLAAEEVDLKIVPCAGVGDEKVKRLLADLIAHDRALTMVLALACKAVGAVEIAGVRNMQAQRLDDALTALFQHVCLVGKGVFGKEPAFVAQSVDIVKTLADIRLGNVVPARVLFAHHTDDLFTGRGFVHIDNVEGDIVNNVYRAGKNVQHDVESAQFIAVNHSDILQINEKAACPGGIFI